MFQFRKSVARAALLTLALGVTATGAMAAPTPIPGGANQLKGVTGTMQSTIFNGKLRFRKFALRTSTPDEQKPDPGGQALTLTYIVSDGVPKKIYGNVSASIADADGVIIDGKSVSVYSAYYSLEPGAAARGSKMFSLPPGFVPVKILLVPGDGPALRINLKPSDLPPAPAPSAAASP